MREKNADGMMKILNGKDALDRLSDECLSLGDRVLVVFSDHRIKQSGLYARVVSLLNMCGIENITYECQTSRYRQAEVESAIALGQKHAVRLIVAIGDEELMFFAKMIAHDFAHLTNTNGKQGKGLLLPIVNVSSIPKAETSTIKIGFSSEQCSFYSSITPSAVFQNFDY